MFNKLDKINKKSRYFCDLYLWDMNLSITSRKKIYASRSSNIEIWMYECSTKCILLKTNGKCADQAGWKKLYFRDAVCKRFRDRLTEIRSFSGANLLINT